tara:strand:+ start:748 stop:963 length:216 start_codon:yes stop_codon:yes gene_type:complete
MTNTFNLISATFGEWLDELSLINHDESPQLTIFLAELYNEGLTPLDARDALEVYHPKWHDELVYLEEHPIG